MNWRNIIEEIVAWLILAAMVTALALVVVGRWEATPEKPADSKGKSGSNTSIQ